MDSLFAFSELAAASLASAPVGFVGGIAFGVLGCLAAGRWLNAPRRHRGDQDARLGDSLLERVPAPIFVRDCNGRFLAANRATCELTGVRPDDLIGRTVEDIAPPHLAKAYRAADARALDAEGSIFAEETRVRDAGGETRDVLVERVAYRPTPDADPWILGAALDITRQKNAERELESARDRAQSAVIARTVFLSTISHEMRTPLNGIIGLADCLVSDDLSSTQQEWVEMIGAAGDRLLTIVEDTLLHAELQSGSLRLHAHDQKVGNLFEAVRAALRESCGTKTLAMQWPEGDVLDVDLVLDAERVGLVLRKLIENAIKFTSKGVVTIEASCLETGDGDALLRVEVRDTGIGIEHSRLDTVFDAFVQADGSADRPYQGTGLGLTIAKQIVDLMDGELTIDSAPGAGTTVRVDLPCAHSAAAHVPAVERSHADVH